ncbi:MAG: DEAD/DEAH box helicase family protein, partial [Methanocella sp.]
MDDYFKKQYVHIKYPKESNGIGLRKAQIGAIHAIASFFTLQNNKSAIIIMPTGSGKTAVITMSPYVLSATKVLVVTPSRMVRGQIAEEFSQLKTICMTTAADTNIEKPTVFEMQHMYNEELLESIKNSQVVVATP